MDVRTSSILWKRGPHFCKCKVGLECAVVAAVDDFGFDVFDPSSLC